MPNDILQIFISGFFSLAGAGIGVAATSKLTNYRLEQLEKRIDNLTENTQRIALLEQRMKQFERRRDNV